MSCQECNEFQDSDKTSFYRWKHSNIEVRACEEHLREVFEALNKAQEPNDNEDEG